MKPMIGEADIPYLIGLIIIISAFILVSLLVWFITYRTAKVYERDLAWIETQNKKVKHWKGGKLQ